MRRIATFRFGTCGVPSTLLALSLVLASLVPARAQDAGAAWTAEPLFRRTLSGYETWFVESPRRNLAIAGLAHQGPVVLVERSTGLVLRELSPDAMALGGVFSGDQELIFIAEKYALKVYETATGSLVSAHGITMNGPNIVANGRAVYLQGRVGDADGVFRLDVGDSYGETSRDLERLPMPPPGIVFDEGRSAPADAGEGVLPRDLADTFFRALSPFFSPRGGSLVFLAKGAVVFFDPETGRPTRILNLEGSDPKLFEMDFAERVGIAYASDGSDHYIHRWCLDEAACSAALRAVRSHRVPLHPVRMAVSPAATEAWISGFRGGQDIGGGMIVDTVGAAGMLDLETGVWIEGRNEETPFWAKPEASGNSTRVSSPGRPRYRLLDHGVVEVGDPSSGEALVYLRVDGNGDWAAFAPDGRWDGSPGALGRLLFLTDGLRTWPPDPSRDRGFAPGLAGKLIASVEDLRRSVTTERGEGALYRMGEELVVLVTVDKPVWLRLYHVEESGRTRLIWPNAHVNQQWIRAGTDLRIPSPECRYTFRVAPPGGKETILAVASTRPFQPGDPVLPYTGEPDPGSMVTRGYAEPARYPEAGASARTTFIAEE